MFLLCVLCTVLSGLENVVSASQSRQIGCLGIGTRDECQLVSASMALSVELMMGCGMIAKNCVCIPIKYAYRNSI